MTPLAPEQMRARKRPGVIAVVSACKLVLGTAVALPLAIAVFGTGVTQWPGGDRVLWEPGGALLAEILSERPWLWVGAVRATLWLGLGAACLGLVPLGSLMVSLCHAGRFGWSRLVARGAELFGAFVALAVLTLLAQAALLLAISLVGLAGRSLLLPRWGDQAADLGFIGVLGLGALGTVALGVLHDLARAVVVRGRLRLREAVPAALSLAKTRAGAVLAAYLPRALASFGLVVGAAAAVLASGLGRSGDGRVLAALLVQQTAVLGVTGLKASWLARALALVAAGGSSGTEPDGGSEQPPTPFPAGP